MNNEKLLAARAEIEAVLKKHDIAGYVVLHMPGFFENFGHYTPSYSVLKPEFDADGFMHQVRIRSNISDYNGDAAKQREHLEATAGFLDGVGILLGRDALSFMELAKTVNSLLHVTHSKLTPYKRPKV